MRACGCEGTRGRHKATCTTPPPTAEERRSRHAANQRRCYQRNPGRRRASPACMAVAQLKCRYGLTAQDFHDMIEAQNGKCAACFEVPSHGRKRVLGDTRLYVDHCHETGRVRGLLCSKCNLALGYLQDNLTKINNLHGYLETA